MAMFWACRRRSEPPRARFSLCAAPPVQPPELQRLRELAQLRERWPPGRPPAGRRAVSYAESRAAGSRSAGVRAAAGGACVVVW